MILHHSPLVFLMTIIDITYSQSAQNDGNKASKHIGDKRRPNILIFIADDLGIGDIGCYGNDTLKTPNIDSIAQQGVQFEHNLAAEVVCTPSRAAMLTGRYAIRSGMASDVTDPRVVISTLAKGGLPSNETTYARVLKQHGYNTAYFGKWHLGIHGNKGDYQHHPLNHGFDYYYGMPLTNLVAFGEAKSGIAFGPTLNPGRLPFFYITRFSMVTLRLIFLTVIINILLIILSSIPKNWKIFILLLSTVILMWVGVNLFIFKFLVRMNGIVMRNKEIVEQPVHLDDLTQRLTTEVSNFLSKVDQDKPFLSVVAYHKVHVALAVDEKFLGKSDHGLYGDSVVELDWSVGKIMSVLKDRGLTENTLIYFTSDHGPENFHFVNGELHGGSAGNFKGGKGNNYEGGVRVPTLCMWPGKFPRGVLYEKPTSSMDLFPTLMNIIGAPLPPNRIIDGVDFSQKLLSIDLSSDLWSTLSSGLSSGLSSTLSSGSFNDLSNDSSSEDRFFFHYCGTALTAVTYNPSTSTHVWKMHLQVPDWPDGLGYFTLNAVRCFGEGIKILDEPLLFDLTVDKSERTPYSVTDPFYREVSDIINEAIVRHRDSIVYAERQLALKKQAPSFRGAGAMCCGSWCSCREEYSEGRFI